ncbi:DUF4386 domain-containing protein [Aquimarina sp. BL5]|uniref:DUF4386 domain-containing protein n=1 Tax=Aquimarina sp. BL5 TaxID=1714860 RepID=UPI000E55164D|nr:DUF4386 domain-containing protein [Aquimarina sp. BL5]AXT50688.1 DUF4386 domain-containing protein [Aquimarina sp. BL5]RKM94213.1 DUF4386 family protein [Aquimarina sp. BL5]
MEFPKKTARLTGFIGIIVLVSGSLAHSINTKLLNFDNAIETTNNILSSESLFRLSFVSGLIMETVFVFYAFFLYKLLRPVNKNNATLMLILALLPVPIFLMNQLNLFAVLLSAKEQMQEQMMFYINLNKNGGFIVSIFFGLWLLPLGYLVFKSSYLPKILGIFLMIGCFGYLINFIQGFLFPGTEATLWTNPVLIITHISELLLMLWLLIMGINVKKWNLLIRKT